MKKPLALYLVAGGYLLAAVLNLVDGFVRFGELFPHHYLFMVFYPAVAYGVFRVRKWGWYLIVGHILFLLVGNAATLVLAAGELDQWPILFLELNLLLVFFLWYFLRTSIRSPFHNPALRWWERQHPRYGARFETTIRTKAGETVVGKGVNLSLGGCYVEIEESAQLEKDELVDFELRYEKHEPLRAQGRVSWISDGSGANVRGAGIALLRLDRLQRERMRTILADVEARWKQATADSGPANSAPQTAVA